MKISVAILIFSAAITTTPPVVTISEEWTRYGNARFEYWIDIPPGFSTIAESDNGDGGIATSDIGNAELRVWGHHIVDGNFVNVIRARIERDVTEGWTIIYQRLGQDWASWSGTNGDRIIYQRAIPTCDNAAANLRIEYDSNAKERLDPIVDRLAASIERSTVCRDNKEPDIPD